MIGVFGLVIIMVFELAVVLAWMERRASRGMASSQRYDSIEDVFMPWDWFWFLLCMATSGIGIVVFGAWYIGLIGLAS